MRENSKKAMLFGVGLDNEDEHVRLTKGDNFRLVGGSEETHEAMQEKCVKFNEKLTFRGKQLENLEKTEFFDLAAECEMNMILPEKKGKKK